jgi:hypothetical protein
MHQNTTTVTVPHDASSEKTRAIRIRASSIFNQETREEVKKFSQMIVLPQSKMRTSHYLMAAK